MKINNLNKNFCWIYFFVIFLLILGIKNHAKNDHLKHEKSFDCKKSGLQGYCDVIPR